MKAMILAAGLGTRLRPLTDDRPKALVEVAGQTLLEIALRRLRHFGVRDVIVNVHHFADLVVDYLKNNANFGMRIEISREEVLLDTGGGLKKAAWFFQETPHEPFILHNVDVLSNIDLDRMLQFQRQRQALATLAVQHRETSRYLLFNAQNQLCGRLPGRGQEPEMVRSSTGMANQSDATQSGATQSGASQSDAIQPQAFSGIHVISPGLLTRMTESGAFSIITSYLRLASEGEKIAAFQADEYYWRDLGRPDNVTHASTDVQQGTLQI